MSSNFEDKVGFAIGTEQCGMTSLYRAMSEEPSVAASHERNHLLESFHKYCCWNELAVDDEGFLAEKEREINQDLGWAEFSFEASGHLSLSVPALHDRLRAKFALMVRNPLHVVASCVHRGYYQDRFQQNDEALALGYQPGREFHHFLARMAPRNEEFQRWNQLTQVGKVAWFWKTLNRRALELLQQLPQTDWAMIRLEDFDFERYRTLTQMFGFESQLQAADFNNLRQRRPDSSVNSQRIPDWTDQEICEFEREIGDLADQLGYPNNFADCVSFSADRKPTKPERPRRSLYSRLGLTG